MSDIAATNVTERLNQFNHDLVQVERKWRTFTINPYALAYEAAFQNYERTTKEQQDADKEKGEMIFLALSLCGGGVMTAAFGKVALKAAGAVASHWGNAALSAICNNNMERAFKAANFFASNKTAHFIAGGVWAELEKRGKDYATGKLKAAMANMEQTPVAFPSAQKLTTIAVKTSLEMFVGEAVIKAYDLAQGIGEDPRPRNYEKLLKFTELRKSKLWTPPGRSVDDGTLSDDIELSFYMNMVMNSDYLKTYEYYEGSSSHDGHAKAREWKQRVHISDISESPGSADYPSGEIGYTKIGSIIKDRMNDLHKKKFKEKFYSGESNLGIMLKAEDTIKRLANDGIQKKIAAAAVAKAA